jgi:hypothetical protein
VPPAQVVEIAEPVELGIRGHESLGGAEGDGVGLRADGVAEVVDVGQCNAARTSSSMVSVVRMPPTMLDAEFDVNQLP